MKTNFVPILCLVAAFLLAIFILGETRNDPALRIAALICVTSLVSTFTAIASTMLIGKDVSYHSDQPGSSSHTESTSTSDVNPAPKIQQ